MNNQQCVNNAFPTVATIIGCPEELACADGLVATPLIIEDPSASQMEENSANVKEIIPEDTSHIKDPIQKALIDNILGNVPTKSQQEKYKCDLCNVEVPTMTTLRLHMSGSKHNKKLKEESLFEEVNSPFIKFINDKKIFICTLCNTTLNARVQIQMHLTGNKHKSKLDGKLEKKEDMVTGDGSTKSKVDATLNLRYCATCGIHVNSETQLQQHIASQKHVNRVNGIATPRGGMRGRGKRTPGSTGRLAPYPPSKGFSPEKSIIPYIPKTPSSFARMSFLNKKPQPLMSPRNQFSLPPVSFSDELQPIFYRRREIVVNNDYENGTYFDSPAPTPRRGGGGGPSLYRDSQLYRDNYYY